MLGLVLVFVGVRGAGKTTACRHLETLGAHRILPSTTRKRRGEDDDEYDFVEVDAWKDDEMAWSFELGGNKYGVSRTAMRSVTSWPLCVMTFDPGSIEQLQHYAAEHPEVEFVRIGLDTIENSEHQHDRLGETDRNQPDSEINKQREVVNASEFVLRGNAVTVGRASEAIAQIMLRRGVLHQDAIEKLIAAGSLLSGADVTRIQPASYDLRLSKHIWLHDIQRFPENGVFKIPPYSYVIAQAEELAVLPKCVVGRFDIKVSLFFRGVILSNGPQVDPGFRGALFCLLYNSSDRDVALMCGDHFATIEFATTAKVTPGYSEQYQLKDKMGQFMNADAAIGPGSRLLERIDGVRQHVDRRIGAQRTWFSVAIGVGFTLILGVAGILYPAATSFRSEADAARKDINTARTELRDELEKFRRELREEKQRLSRTPPVLNGGEETDLQRDAGADASADAKR